MSASACCACSSSITSPRTSSCRCPASKESSARWPCSSGWPSCPGAARRRRSSVVSWWRCRSRRSGSAVRSALSTARPASARTPPPRFLQSWSRGEPLDVRQALGGRTNLAELLQHHAGGVPGTGHERLLRRQREPDLERHGVGFQDQTREIDTNRCARTSVDESHQRVEIRARRGHAWEADGHRVAEENVGERLAHDRPNAPPIDRLRRVLARGSTSEVAIDQEDARARKAWIVEWMRGRLPIILEDVTFHALERDRAQVARGDDPVRVDVVAAKRQRSALDRRDSMCRLDHCTISRTSTTSPARAAAATIAGLISSVLPVGLPCRPLKFRFDDEAHTWRPSSLSEFMPRHIEQPASRQSNPASRKTSSRPSRSAACCTEADPGTTSAFTCGATRRPRTIRAASRKSDSRALVHEPMNPTSNLTPSTPCPRPNPM